MKTLNAIAASVVLVASAGLHAQTIEIARSGSQSSAKGSAQYFTGSVRALPAAWSHSSPVPAPRGTRIRPARS
jgi:hypothetical protein